MWEDAVRRGRGLAPWTYAAQRQIEPFSELGRRQNGFSVSRRVASTRTVPHHNVTAESWPLCFFLPAVAGTERRFHVVTSSGLSSSLIIFRKLVSGKTGSLVSALERISGWASFKFAKTVKTVSTCL